MSCCFVHIGLIHLACNLYGVYAIGRGAEQMWGRLRSLAIYLLSGFCGSCVTLAYGPGFVHGEPPQFVPALLAGASGALCGILGAEFVWLLLNGRFLPRRVVRRWWWGMIINLFLLAGFSAMANVSALAHGGGLFVGAAAAVLLNVQRFAPAVWGWLALLLLAALPWRGDELIQRQRTVSETWREAEESAYYADFKLRLATAYNAHKEATDVTAKLTAGQRLSRVEHARKLYETIDADLARTDYRSPEVIKSRQEARDKIARGLEKLTQLDAEIRPVAEEEAGRQARAQSGKARMTGR